MESATTTPPAERKFILSTIDTIKQLGYRVSDDKDQCLVAKSDKTNNTRLRKSGSGGLRKNMSDGQLNIMDMSHVGGSDV